MATLENIASLAQRLGTRVWSAILTTIIYDTRIYFWSAGFAIAYVFSFVLCRYFIYPSLQQYGQKTIENTINASNNTTSNHKTINNNDIFSQTRNRRQSVTSRGHSNVLDQNAAKCSQNGSKNITMDTVRKENDKAFKKSLLHNDYMHEQSRAAANKLVALINAVLTLYHGWRIMKAVNMTEAQVQRGCDVKNDIIFDELIDMNTGYVIVDTMFMLLYDRTKRSLVKKNVHLHAFGNFGFFFSLVICLIV